MKTFDELLHTVRTLHGPRGCPWHHGLGMADILPLLADELQEVQDACKKKDWGNLEEELGDVLLNILILARIAEEEKKFSTTGMLRRTVSKLKQRVTWVFGPDVGTVHTSEEAIAKWIENKKKLKAKDNR